MSSVIICGSQRSGTTLLATLLGSHSDVLEEDKVRSYRWITNLNHVPQLLAKSPELTQENLVHSLLEKTRSGKIGGDSVIKNSASSPDLSIRDFLKTAIENKLQEHNKKVWLDKAPNMEHYFKDLFWYMPDVKVINMIRDGRAVAASRLQRLGHTLTHSSQVWVKSVTQTLTAAQLIGGGQFMTIRYEDLVEHPEKTLRQVCTFLDIPYEDDLVQLDQIVGGQENSYVVNRFDKSKINAWATRLSDGEIAKMESIQGRLLHRLGYPLRNEKYTTAAKSLSLRQEIRASTWNSLQLLFKSESQGMRDKKTSTIRMGFRKRLSNLVRNFRRDVFSFDLYRERYIKPPKINR